MSHARLPSAHRSPAWGLRPWGAPHPRPRRLPPAHPGGVLKPSDASSELRGRESGHKAGAHPRVPCAGVGRARVSVRPGARPGSTHTSLVVADAGHHGAPTPAGDWGHSCPRKVPGSPASPRVSAELPPPGPQWGWARLARPLLGAPQESAGLRCPSLAVTAERRGHRANAMDASGASVRTDTPPRPHPSRGASARPPGPARPGNLPRFPRKPTQQRTLFPVRCHHEAQPRAGTHPGVATGQGPHIIYLL